MSTWYEITDTGFAAMDVRGGMPRVDRAVLNVIDYYEDIADEALLERVLGYELKLVGTSQFHSGKAISSQEIRSALRHLLEVGYIVQSRY